MSHELSATCWNFRVGLQHWNGIFYSKDLASKDRLKYFSEHFNTAEINYSFYHLPKPESYENWYSQTPEGFIFAVKASRFITHVKRQKGSRLLGEDS
jgi:uncharacterized protein YecE (DUF72 family)